MVSPRDREKRLAAEAAVGEVEDGMRLGLGSGSTAQHAVRLLGERVRQGLRVVGVATSEETARVAREEGIPLNGLLDVPELDLTIDGADEIDAQLNLIKGGGGALLHEKIVASASRRMIVIADASKVVEGLGAFPLPVEVIPFAEAVVARRIRRLGADPILRVAGDGTPFVTDEGNHILDCPFGTIQDPLTLAASLCTIPGIVEHGLFLHLADEAIVASGDEIRVLTARRG